MSTHSGTAEPLATSTHCWCPLPSPKGACCPALPFPPLMHFSRGGSHHCLIRLLLINNMVQFAKKHKVLFQDAIFGTLDIVYYVGYWSSSRGPPNVASKPAVGYYSQNCNLRCSGKNFISIERLSKHPNFEVRNYKRRNQLALIQKLLQHRKWKKATTATKPHPMEKS